MFIAFHPIDCTKIVVPYNWLIIQTYMYDIFVYKTLL